MPRRTKPLTALAVRSLPVGRHFDGDGLELLVRGEDVAFWSLRYRFGGRRRETGLGRARGPNAVTLAEAREKARTLREQVRGGTDPLGEKRAQRVEAKRQDEAGRVTVRQAAEAYIVAHAPSWKQPLHAKHWRASLRMHAFPTLGDRTVGGVTMSDVADTLRPIWTEKPETAGKVRSRLELIFGYAKAHGWLEGDNPAAWRDGGLKHVLPALSKVRTVRHHPALPYADVPAFLRALAVRDGASAAALAFVVFTAARSGEVRGATWGEIDMEARVWTVPAARMKAGREHRVPLSEPALAVLRRVMPSVADTAALVFAGARPGRPLSDMALTMVLRKMGHADVVPHGFRSSFRDWCAESDHSPRELAEVALAHAVESKVEAAYRRGDMFDRRRGLMDRWGAYAMAGAAPGKP